MAAWTSGFQLRIVKGNQQGLTVPLTEQVYTLGRASAQGEKAPGYIFFLEPTVSRVHAELRWNEKKKLYFLHHQSKTNPTLLEGVPVDKKTPRALDKGQKIQMGYLILEMEPQSAPEVRPQRADDGRPPQKSPEESAKTHKMMVGNILQALSNLNQERSEGVSAAPPRVKEPAPPPPRPSSPNMDPRSAPPAPFLERDFNSGDRGAPAAVAAGGAPIQFTVAQGPDQGHVFALREQVGIIGRSMGREDPRRGQGVLLDDDSLPREAAYVVWQNREGAYGLSEADPVGLAIRVRRIQNGHPVDVAVGHGPPVLLQDGDFIQLGRSSLLVRAQANMVARGSAAPARDWSTERAPDGPPAWSPSDPRSAPQPGPSPGSWERPAEQPRAQPVQPVGQSWERPPAEDRGAPWQAPAEPPRVPPSLPLTVAAEPSPPTPSEVPVWARPAAPSLPPRSPSSLPLAGAPGGEARPSLQGAGSGVVPLNFPSIHSERPAQPEAPVETELGSMLDPSDVPTTMGQGIPPRHNATLIGRSTSGGSLSLANARPPDRAQLEAAATLGVAQAAPPLPPEPAPPAPPAPEPEAPQGGRGTDERHEPQPLSWPWRDASDFVFDFVSGPNRGRQIALNATELQDDRVITLGSPAQGQFDIPLGGEQWMAALRYRTRRFALLNQGPDDSILVNRVPLKRADQVVLMTGDRIDIGDSCFRFLERGVVEVLQGFQVVVESGVDSDQDKVYPFFKQRLLIGRGKNCDVRLNDLEVSRIHVALVQREGRFFVQHRSETNPTFLNGMSLLQGGERHLSPGDRIRLSSLTLLQFTKAEPRKRPPVAPAAARRPDLP